MARSAARSSSLGSQVPAAALARTCSARGRAGDHRGHGRLRGQPADRDLEHADARARRRTRSSASMMSQSARRRGAGSGAAGQPGALRRLSPRRYLPVSRPLASGKNGSRPRPNCSQAGTTSASTVALQQAVVVLRADERGAVAGPGGPVGVGDLPAGEVGVAEVAHLAGADQVVERGERLLDRRARVGLVHLVEVDVVGAEPAQRRLDRADDVAPRAAGAVVRAVERRPCPCRTWWPARPRRGGP